MFRFELMLLLCFSPHLFVSYSWCLSVPVCFMTEAVCRRVGDNAAFVFTTVVCALVLVLFTLSLYLPERKPETPKVPHILPEVPKPEVFVVTMAETGPTAAQVHVLSKTVCAFGKLYTICVVCYFMQWHCYIFGFALNDSWHCKTHLLGVIDMI